MFEFKIDLSHAKLTSLNSEQDFRSEARRLLPSVLEKIAEQVAEKMWVETQKAFKMVPGVKVNQSQSDKNKYIRNAASNYRQKASASDKAKIEDEIMKQLKAGKNPINNQGPQQ